MNRPKTLTAMKNKMFLLPIPLGLIALGGIVAFLMHKLDGQNAAELQEGRTYRCWVVEAEVADRPMADRAWDLDGSAPDLMAALRFRGNTVLTTSVARDALIAHWQPLSLNLKDLAAGEIAADSIRKVAHLTLRQGDTLTAAVFDHDLINDEFAGGFSVALNALHVGENELVAESEDAVLRRVLIMIVHADSKAMPQSERYRVPADQIVWAAAAVSGSLDQEWTDMAHEIKRSLREASRTLQDAIERSLNSPKTP